MLGRMSSAHFRLMRYLIAFLLAATGLLAPWAQGTETAQQVWAQVEDTAGVGYVVRTDAAGNIYVGGDSFGKYLVTKYAKGTGALLWVAVEDGSGNVRDLAVDAQGNVAVTGGLTTGGETQRDIVTLKLSGATGAKLWRATYVGTGVKVSSTTDFADDVGEGVAVDAEGNVIVCGYTHFYRGPSVESRDTALYTAKYRAVDGVKLWEKTYGGYTTEFGIDCRSVPAGVKIAANGDVMVTGSGRDTAVRPDHRPETYYYSARYAATTGNPVWETRSRLANDADNSINVYAVGLGLDGAGNVLIGGQCGGFEVVKLHGATGALLWRNRRSSDLEPERAQGFSVGPNGDAAMTGYYGQTPYTLRTVKFAGATGATQWETTFSSPTTDGASRKDQGYAVALDASGNVFATGPSFNSARVNEIYTAKLAAANGATLWDARYAAANPALDAYPFPSTGLAVTPNGGVAVTGEVGGRPVTVQYGPPVVSPTFTQEVEQKWTVRKRGTLPDGLGEGNAVATDSAGNVVVTGSVFDSTAQNLNVGQRAFYTAKYAGAGGHLLWERRLSPPIQSVSNQGYAVAVDADGNVVVAGACVRPHQTVGTENDYYTAKYAAATGALLWEKYFDFANDHATALVLDGAGNAIVTGVSSTPDFGRSSYNTVKYAAANGAVLWQARTNSANTTSDAPTAIAADAAGNVAVTGHSDDKIYTVLYAAGDGHVLWEKYTPAAGPETVDVAMDAQGNVAVTGTLENAQGRDFATLLYAANDGHVIWQTNFDGAQHSTDNPSAVAFDGSGNVLVTGRSFAGDAACNMYTAKYAAATGAVLWSRVFKGPKNYASGAALSLDAAGNVAVAGDFFNLGNDYNVDYYTAKYAAADGHTIWEKSYDGPAGGAENLYNYFSVNTSNRLAVTPDGDVVITGKSEDKAEYTGDNTSFTTIKYAVVPTEVLAPSTLTIGPVSAGAPLVVTAQNASARELTLQLQMSTTAGVWVDVPGGLLIRTGSGRYELSLASYAAGSGVSLRVRASGFNTVASNSASAGPFTLTPPQQFSFSAATYSANENASSAVITVNRTGGTAGTASVVYQVVQRTAHSYSLVDFDPTPEAEADRTLTFAAGEATKTFTITLHDDALVEGDQTLDLALRSPSPGTVLGAQSQATLTLVDNEPAGALSAVGSVDLLPGPDAYEPSRVVANRVTKRVYALGRDSRASAASNCIKVIDAATEQVLGGILTDGEACAVDSGLNLVYTAHRARASSSTTASTLR